MSKKTSMGSKLIAPCGMNCGICVGHLRDKNKCPGCGEMSKNPDYCKKCGIRNCKFLEENNLNFCSDKCDKYPCKRLKSLDKRYRAKYAMSMLDNLKNIKESGIRKFIENEKNRWIRNDKVYCVHNKKYYD